MKFRPCIDIHNGKVKQIVGGSLTDENSVARENFVSSRDAVFYGRMYRELGLTGGHMILLNPVDSPFYESTKRQAMETLGAVPGFLQVGGGITSDNARQFLNAGADKVIVTSYVFKGGKINMANLKRLVKTVGRENIVLDLSCKRTDEGNYLVVTDRWQKLTDVELSVATLDELSEYCDEFLVHAADVEGKQSGIEENVVKILSSFDKRTVTYAGGISQISDIDLIKRTGKGKVDVTVGSALDIFGGSLKMQDVIDACK